MKRTFRSWNIKQLEDLLDVLNTNIKWKDTNITKLVIELVQEEINLRILNNIN